MHISTNSEVVKTAIIACDVSKDSLSFVVHLHPKIIEETIANTTVAIERWLSVIGQRAGMAGYERLQVVAEATGIYHFALMRIARQRGCDVALVSGEAVAKMRVIETNDTGKTDLKDPHVIHSLARLGKTQVCRELAGSYLLLREWHKEYDHADRCAVEAKGAIHTLLRQLYPDFGFSSEFLYTRSGQALFELYQGNPYLIVARGKSRFEQRMRKAAPRIRQHTLDALYAQALSSLRYSAGADHAELLSWRLMRTWQDYQRHAQRKAEVKKRMEALYQELRQKDRRLPDGEPGVVSTFHLARLVAETGPLDDFANRRKLLRYAGMNLRERQSGLYRGQTRGSKKGRKLLRKTLGLIVLPLVRKTDLYGTYYHQLKERMAGTKAMAAVMRKFLKMFWGWYQSGKSFDRDRVFTCASLYEQAA